MGYRVQFSNSAGRQFEKLDTPVKRRIEGLIERLESIADPRTVGDALHGDLKAHWKYRAGDWRLIVIIHDHVLVIEVIEIAHRSKAY